jgi:ribosome-binding protein aMBF1 (putative translation factor)
MQQCEICGKEYGYIIANPIKYGEVRLCEDHYQHLEKARAAAYRDLMEGINK